MPKTVRSSSPSAVSPRQSRIWGGNPHVHSSASKVTWRHPPRWPRAAARRPPHSRRSRCQCTRPLELRMRVPHWGCSRGCSGGLARWPLLCRGCWGCSLCPIGAHCASSIPEAGTAGTRPIIFFSPLTSTTLGTSFYPRQTLRSQNACVKILISFIGDINELCWLPTRPGRRPSWCAVCVVYCLVPL